MKKNIIIIALAFIANLANAQVYKTPSTVNMSKSYLPFNAATLDLNTQTLTVSVKFKTDIPYNISKISMIEIKGQKRYSIDTKEGGSFLAIVFNGELKELTEFAGKSVDWVLSE